MGNATSHAQRRRSARLQGQQSSQERSEDQPAQAAAGMIYFHNSISRHSTLDIMKHDILYSERDMHVCQAKRVVPYTRHATSFPVLGTYWGGATAREKHSNRVIFVSMSVNWSEGKSRGDVLSGFCCPSCHLPEEVRHTPALICQLLAP